MKYVIANWKMNPVSHDEAIVLAGTIEKNAVAPSGVRVVLCPPFPYLEGVGHVINYCLLGAQDLSPFDKGAYTGQVSGAQLSDLGVRYVIIGHSERRLYARETDADVATKLKACLRHNLVPVLCLGAGLRPQDDDAKIKSVIREQFVRAVHGAAVNELIVVYEPTWAISTISGGRTPTPEHVFDISNFIRQLIDHEHIANFTVLYGGSVSKSNAGSFKGIDGFLVGGASLEPGEFINIIHAIA